MRSNDDLIRIYNNIQTLLAEGVFPGKFAPGVTECFEHARNMLIRLEQDSGKEAGSDGSGVGNAPDDTGLAGSEIQPGSRKSRGRKGK